MKTKVACLLFIGATFSLQADRVRIKSLWNNKYVSVKPLGQEYWMLLANIEHKGHPYTHFRISTKRRRNCFTSIAANFGKTIQSPPEKHTGGVAVVFLKDAGKGKWSHFIIEGSHNKCKIKSYGNNKYLTVMPKDLRLQPLESTAGPEAQRQYFAIEQIPDEPIHFEQVPSTGLRAKPNDIALENRTVLVRCENNNICKWSGRCWIRVKRAKWKKLSRATQYAKTTHVGDLYLWSPTKKAFLYSGDTFDPKKPSVAIAKNGEIWGIKNKSIYRLKHFWGQPTLTEGYAFINGVQKKKPTIKPKQHSIYQVAQRFIQQIEAVHQNIEKAIAIDDKEDKANQNRWIRNLAYIVKNISGYPIPGEIIAIEHLRPRRYELKKFSEEKLERLGRTIYTVYSKFYALLNTIEKDYLERGLFDLLPTNRTRLLELISAGKKHYATLATKLKQDIRNIHRKRENPVLWYHKVTFVADNMNNRRKTELQAVEALREEIIKELGYLPLVINKRIQKVLQTLEPEYISQIKVSRNAKTIEEKITGYRKAIDKINITLSRHNEQMIYEAALLPLTKIALNDEIISQNTNLLEKILALLSHAKHKLVHLDLLEKQEALIQGRLDAIFSAREAKIAQRNQEIRIFNERLNSTGNEERGVMRVLQALTPNISFDQRKKIVNHLLAPMVTKTLAHKDVDAKSMQSIQTLLTCVREKICKGLNKEEQAQVHNMIAVLQKECVTNSG